MFGLGNLFSGLGNLFTMPNMIDALSFLGKGMDLYGSINDLMKTPQMPDYQRLDGQGNQAQPMPSPMGPQDQARRFASARSHMSERGVGPGGAFDNPLMSMPGMFQDPASMYAALGQGQAMPYDEELNGSYY